MNVFIVKCTCFLSFNNLTWTGAEILSGGSGIKPFRVLFSIVYVWFLLKIKHKKCIVHIKYCNIKDFVISTNYFFFSFFPALFNLTIINTYKQYIFKNPIYNVQNMCKTVQIIKSVWYRLQKYINVSHLNMKNVCFMKDKYWYSEY